MRDERALVEARSRWVEAVNAGSVDQYSAVLAEDVVWLRPGQLALQGRRQVLDWLAPFFEQFDYDFSVADTAVRIIDDWAVERAVFMSRVRPKQADRWEDHAGLYLMIWRWQTGAWYVHQYVDVTGLLAVDPANAEP